MKNSAKRSRSSTTPLHITTAADRIKPSVVGTHREPHSSLSNCDVVVPVEQVRRRRWKLPGFGWIDESLLDRSKGDRRPFDQMIPPAAVLAHDFERITRARIAAYRRRRKSYSAYPRKPELD